MKLNSAQIKKMARTALSGKWKTAVLLTLLYTVISTALSLCSLPFDSSTSTINVLIGWVISLIVSLLTGLLSAGSSYFFLNICRSNDFSCKDLFYAFKADPDRFLIVTLITSLPTIVASLISQFLPTPAANASEMAWMVYLLITMVILYAGIIISWIMSLFFALSHYLLLDYPEMGAMDSLRMSAHLMKGNKWRYFCLLCSFLGWILVSAFTMGIGFLWISPYMEMSMVYFYANILQQLSNQQSEEEQNYEV